MMSLEQFQELCEELGFTLSLSTARTLEGLRQLCNIHALRLRVSGRQGEHIFSEPAVYGITA